MDLNYVFLRQQVERVLAKKAASEPARKAHEAMAQAYERAIEEKSGGRIMFPWHRPDAAVDRSISVRPTQSASS
jgi:hypothetical protein